MRKCGFPKFTKRGKNWKTAIFFKKTLDKYARLCYNKYNEREVIIMTDTKWIWVKTEQAFGNGFDEYISADGHYCKQVWFDGYEEFFEIA